MERLTSADAWYLYVESRTVPLHVLGVLVLDPSTAPAPFTFASMRAYIDGRLDLMPALGRRLVEVPLAIDHPSWIDDADFDLDQHLHHHVLTEGGSDAALRTFIGEFAAVRLDRTRPLWDLVLVEGLADGTVAIVMKLHHCIIDGVSGMEIMAHLLDLSPTPPERERTAVRPDERPPGDVETIAAATWNRLSDPARPFRAARGMASSLVKMAGGSIGRRLGGSDGAAHPLNAPRTRLNASLTANRAVAFDGVPLADLKVIKRAFDVTINDVVLAACTQGLRKHLAIHDRVPDRALVCSVPVSTHGQDDGDGSTNQVSSLFVHLPVHLADPLEQLAAIHAGGLGAKEIQASLGPGMIGDVVDIMPPPVFQFASTMYSRSGLADRMAPIHNLIVSNVVGSPVPLYLDGATVLAMFPFGPLMEGAGLNITVLSHVGTMNIGLIACPDLVPEPEELLRSILDGFTTLLGLVGGAAGSPAATDTPGAGAPPPRT